MRPPKIFLNYRRDDGREVAVLLFEMLLREFGEKNVFLDETMTTGIVFPKLLRKEVAACDIFLAIIGPSWLEIVDDKGHRRLDDPNDFVRMEIALALDRDIPVIPILLKGTKIPRGDQLPPDLQHLSVRLAFEIRDTTLRADCDRLISELKTIVPAPAPKALSEFAAGTFFGALVGVPLTGVSSDLIRNAFTDESVTRTFIVGIAFVTLGILGFVASIRLWPTKQIFGASFICALFAAPICIGAATPFAKWVPPDLHWLGPLAYLVLLIFLLIVWRRVTSRARLGLPTKPQT
jgi:hypothetical protein